MSKTATTMRRIPSDEETSHRRTLESPGRSLTAGRLRLAVAGMGGFAGHLTSQLLEDAVRPDGRVEVVAVCDPKPDAHGGRAAELAARGVIVHDAFDALLDRDDIEAIWLPLPIDLHRPFTERALAAGKHVVVEKPAAGTVQDVDAMIAARDASGLMCAVGFQDLYRPDVRRLKQRLLSGELGRPVRANVVGCWPRGTRYFTRNAWAGRVRAGGAWVLDSVANNAMAHFVNLALFLLGAGEHASASIARVEAELYRVNDIETFDTCTLRVTTAVGVECTIALTHACEQTVEPTVTIVTDRTHVCVLHPDTIVYGSKGPAERGITRGGGALLAASHSVARHIRGGSTAPIATLESARVHTQLVNAIAEAAPVHPAPETTLRSAIGPVLAIVGIEDALQRCAREGRLLHELEVFAWARPGGAREVTPEYTFGGRMPGADGACTSRR